MEELKFYTVKDLKKWIECGVPEGGLSEQLITKTRAYSIIHNPFVTDEMPIVASLWIAGEVAAFVAAFPERLQRPDCMTHWFHSLYVAPKFEGKGYGLVVLGSLMEQYGDDPVFDLDAVKTSVEILSYLGLKAGSFTQFDFRNKMIRRDSVKGELAYRYDRWHRNLQSGKTLKDLRKTINNTDYSLRYERFVDHEAYDFMLSHSEGDAFLRKRETLNWMLSHPFVHEAPLMERVQGENLFTSSKAWQRYCVVKVYVQRVLVGMYILCDSSTMLTLSYLYYNVDCQREVLLSIVEHILKLGSQRFVTTNATVASFIESNGLFATNKTNETSFCYDQRYEDLIHRSIQGGDGDMILN
jgi:hypothetical protein